MQQRNRCRQTRGLALLALPLAVLSGVSRTAADGPQPAQAAYPHAVVVADHALASQAGVEVLKKGGNVVDAAVATSFALSVVRPDSCGIGGGGFMVIWNAGKREAVVLDYRERAPQAATRDMFAPRENTDPERSRKGPLAAAIPGSVAGLCFALEKYGSLDLKTVLGPALRLAREGVPLDRHARDTQRAALREFDAHPEYRRRFAALYDNYLNAGRPWTDADRFCSPQLKVLELIAERGPDAFYRGPVADALVTQSTRGGGLFTLDDLQQTAPVIREPLRATFDGLEILAVPPPSSGGIALIESLNMLSAGEGHPLSRRRKPSEDWSSTTRLHLLAETLKHAFADRAEFLGDADFVNVPINRLTSAEYAAALAGRIDPKRTQPPEAYGSRVVPDDGGTSHFSIIDHDGNAVACTETINLAFGSFVVEPAYGIVFNNQMDDFSAVPGEPNAFGLIQSEANAVAPRKKPLSSMCPAIVLREGRAAYALGASGGPRIISATLQALINMTRCEMPPQQAVAAPRIHHQWQPDILYLEGPLNNVAGTALSALGHTVRRQDSPSACQAASRTENGLRGGSDPRKAGRPAGY